MYGDKVPENNQRRWRCQACAGMMYESEVDRYTLNMWIKGHQETIGHVIIEEVIT